jgi:hypothetical protein
MMQRFSSSRDITMPLRKVTLFFCLLCSFLCICTTGSGAPDLREMAGQRADRVRKAQSLTAAASF